MNSELKKPVRVLKTFFWSALAIAVLFVVLYECGILMPGGLQLEDGDEFVLMTLVELATLAAIPLALYMFRIKGIRQKLVSDPARQLQRYGVLRLLILEGGIVSNTLLYYMTMTPSFGYMAIILAIAMTFVYPSQNRCERDTAPDTPEHQ